MLFALFVVPVIADLVPLAETPTPTAQVPTESTEISPKIITKIGNLFLTILISISMHH